MKFKTKDYVAGFKTSSPLRDFNTRLNSVDGGDDGAAKLLEKSQIELAEHQQLLYAQNEWAVLIVLQGPDTAGKDGLIKHVMSGVNPAGCEVTPFKAPTHHELDHDFLWRAHVRAPARGMIGVFNRSYYEDIVVPYVHPEIIENTQLPREVRKGGYKKILAKRCDDIVAFEKYLARQGTLIIKIFLNLGKEEQRERLLARLEDPAKNWKFADGDIIERGHWNDYHEANNFCIHHTGHEVAPWHIVPADDKPTARLLASHIICKRIGDLNLAVPKVDKKRAAELDGFRKKLAED